MILTYTEVSTQTLTAHLALTTGPINLIFLHIWLHARGALVVAVTHNFWKTYFNDCSVLYHRWAPTPYSCKWSTTASVWNLVSAKDNRHGGQANAGGFFCWYSNFESDVLHRWCFGTCLLSYCRYRSSKSPMSIDWETGSQVHTSETENKTIGSL